MKPEGEMETATKAPVAHLECQCCLFIPFALCQISSSLPPPTPSLSLSFSPAFQNETRAVGIPTQRPGGCDGTEMFTGSRF